MSGENKRNVRPVKVGGLVLDGKKIYIQSMLNGPSTDIEAGHNIPFFFSVTYFDCQHLIIFNN